MKRNESNVLMTVTNSIEGVENTYRLIRVTTECYSLFLTSVFEGETDEEFCNNIGTDYKGALSILNKLVECGVTACTLNDTVHDLLSESAYK